MLQQKHQQRVPKLACVKNPGLKDTDFWEIVDSWFGDGSGIYGSGHSRIRFKTAFFDDVFIWRWLFFSNQELDNKEKPGCLGHSIEIYLEREERDTVYHL